MADSDLINEELERVFTLYSAQLRQFRRALYALIVTSLTLFILIVVPFLTFRDQLAELHTAEQDSALTDQLPDDAAISPPVYLALYAASLAFLVGALWHIRQVGNKPPEQTASSGPEPEGA